MQVADLAIIWGWVGRGGGVDVDFMFSFSLIMVSKDSLMAP